MKKLVTATEWFGPFNEIITTEDSYVCDGCYFPFTVVGDDCAIEDYDPSTDVIPPTQDEIDDAFASYEEQTQQRLDDFAATRGYADILAAVSYASSSVTQYKTEGQYCLTQRDATWEALYEIFGEIEGGARPLPANYADIEKELPALVWPN